MEATIWNNGTTVWGIRIGNKNREEHFSKDQGIIIIKIDDMDYGFELKPSFWRKCCEIRGKPIKMWVEKNKLESGDKVRLDALRPYIKFKLSL